MLVCTQPHEPFPAERVQALRQAVDRLGSDGPRIDIDHYDQAIEQNPEAPGFWDMWRNLLWEYGVGPNTIIVASEPYGQKLAEITGARFMPYDIERDLNFAKASRIREHPASRFSEIIPEFQQYLRTTVTIFGAESTGKTTLARYISDICGMDPICLYEYARPYLEYTINEITVRSMTDIWRGQRALQLQGRTRPSTPLVIQDTDLYSTIGYWELPDWYERLGDCPEGLRKDARELQSDLYLITRSNIPFERDPLRYGGDHREATDEYWVDLCEKYGLPYYVIQSQSLPGRFDEVWEDLIEPAIEEKLSKLAYDRQGL